MKSIKSKLILSTTIMLMITILCIAIPVIIKQVKSQQETLTESATYMMLLADIEVEKFLKTPQDLLSATAAYATSTEIDVETMENFLESMVKNSTKSISSLYYATALSYKDGGMFAFDNHYKLPSDFDQTTRIWYKEAKATDKFVMTEPYVDTVTGGLVVTLAKGIYENGIFTGVVAVDITLDELSDMINDFSLSSEGTSFILDGTGRYITNKDSSKILNKNFFDEYGFGKYKSAVNSMQGVVNINAGDKYYLIGNKLTDVSGWLFVSIGPRTELFSHINKNIATSFLIAFLCLAAAFVVSILISQTLVKPIKQVDDAVNGIAEGNANLTHRLKATSKDEVGHLVKGFNKFMEKLHGIISDVKTSKNNLSDVRIDLQESIDSTASAITEILSNIKSVDGQVNQQVASVNQTSAAVTEIAENINSLERMIESQSDGVSQASVAVEEMLGNISSVNSSVEKMSKSFNDLQRNTNEGIERQQLVTQQISEIAAQSEALQDANKAITSVASQTNLLAMNAAIEAAHAGEAGKGFSVVADEIRKLSETSAAESKKISEELRKISDTISSVVVTARESSESFSGVSSKIQQTDELVEQIKAAMEEQQIGSKQIVDALKLMNDTTSEVKTASHEMAVGNKAILSEIQNLQDATHVIKDGMNEMTIGAREMNQTSAALSDISTKVNESINQIGLQIDQFQV